MQRFGNHITSPRLSYPPSWVRTRKFCNFLYNCVISTRKWADSCLVCNCTSVEHSGGKISRPLLMFLKAMAQRLGELWRIRFRKILRGPHWAWCSGGSKSPWSRWLKFSVREAMIGNLLTAVDAGNEEVEQAHRRCSSFDAQFPRSFDMQITTRCQACLE